MIDFCILIFDLNSKNDFVFYLNLIEQKLKKPQTL